MCFGWMNFGEKDNDFKHVQTVKGGGTRHVSVDRYTTVREIQEMAESHFPKGKDHEGKGLSCL